MESRLGTVVFAATSFPFPIQRAIHLDAQGYASMFQPECFSSRSQDLTEAYHDAGQFYWATPETWSTVTNLFEGMRPLLLPVGACKILTPKKIGSGLSCCISF